ncbi:hypothetical protein [Aquabacterium sp.]|uniref:hypothetical protein n=1 Tax=Aquabacterium sp. TaxID=1872578 RepID=UPI002C872C53|nr:hypothetical protein [Aquabacterium sp.]HSW04959.1 hypothetical protein [Aquabacterium sp.]
MLNAVPDKRFVDETGDRMQLHPALRSRRLLSPADTTVFSPTTTLRRQRRGAESLLRRAPLTPTLRP